MACKTCEQSAPLILARRADRRLQRNADPVAHTQDIATVQGGPAGRFHVANRV
jgi:hypothetical protein